MLNKDYFNKNLSQALKLGASYADVRITISEDKQLLIKDGKVEKLEHSHGTGFGVRVIVDGSWGFSGSKTLTQKEAENVTLSAVKLAKASSVTRRRDIDLCPNEPIIGKYNTNVKVDPFDVPVEDIIEELVDQVNIVKDQSRYIKTSSSLFRAHKQSKYFVSTEGSQIKQNICWCGGGVFGVALRNGEAQRRSYPAFDGSYYTGGYEAYQRMMIGENSERVGKEAADLLDAEKCPVGSTDLLIGPEQLWLQIHESCGHPTELDRVLGSEVDSAGTSFLMPHMLNDFQYGSEEVNLVLDSTIEGGLGTFGFDDEGVPAKKRFLIKEGEFVGYQSSRDTAPVIGMNESTGSSRSMYGDDLPIVRMTNLNLLPGDWKKDEIVNDTKKGMLVDTIKAWSIDDRRLNFQFGCEMGKLIEGGEIKKTVKNPTYTGISYEFWRSCDASAFDDWKMMGTPGCGKGRPSQSMYVGHGSSTTRFKDVRVGGNS
jgi:TldD protein